MATPKETGNWADLCDLNGNQKGTDFQTGPETIILHIKSQKIVQNIFLIFNMPYHNECYLYYEYFNTNYLST